MQLHSAVWLLLSTLHNLESSEKAVSNKGLHGSDRPVCMSMENFPDCYLRGKVYMNVAGIIP